MDAHSILDIRPSIDCGTYGYCSKYFKMIDPPVRLKILDVVGNVQQLDPARSE